MLGEKLGSLIYIQFVWFFVLWGKCQRFYKNIISRKVLGITEKLLYDN
jgi:hypothetical protein